MTPIEPIIPGFKVKTTVFAKDQPEYLQLPAHRADDQYGTVTSRWKLTWSERFMIFITGNLWHQQMTFGRSLQPIKMTTECPIFGHLMGDEEE